MLKFKVNITIFKYETIQLSYRQLKFDVEKYPALPQIIREKEDYMLISRQNNQ